MIDLRHKTYKELAELPHWHFASNLRFAGSRYLLIPAGELVYVFSSPGAEELFLCTWAEFAELVQEDLTIHLEARAAEEEQRARAQAAIASISIDLDL